MTENTSRVTRDVRETFGGHLRSLRGQHSVEWLARRIGASLTTVVEWELGRRRPGDTERVLAIAKALNAPPARLLYLWALDRGSVDLDTSTAERLECAVALAALWGSMTAEHFAAVVAALEER